MTDSELARETLTYTACYCEENAYKLCETIREKSATERDTFDFLGTYVVFVSSEIGWVEMHRQRAGKDPEGRIIWDYHVFVVTKTNATHWVYDFDTTLEFPVRFETYVAESFRASQVPRAFRVVAAREYLLYFSSDRRHMRKSHEPSEFNSPPPPYPSIQSPIPFVTDTGDDVREPEHLIQYWGPAHRLMPTDEFRLPLYLRMLPSPIPSSRTAFLGRVVSLQELCDMFAEPVAQRVCK